MKKILLASTILAGTAGFAAAAELNVLDPMLPICDTGQFTYLAMDITVDDIYDGSEIGVTFDPGVLAFGLDIIDENGMGAGSYQVGWNIGADELSGDFYDVAMSNYLRPHTGYDRPGDGDEFGKDVLIAMLDGDVDDQVVPQILDTWAGNKMALTTATTVPTAPPYYGMDHIVAYSPSFENSVKPPVHFEGDTTPGATVTFLQQGAGEILLGSEGIYS